VTEDRDNRISDLYQQSSQETPPAHLDRAVLEMARKSVRRRAFSPFGNHWVAGGALVGVVMLSVLLIQTVPQQQEHYLPLPERDALAPLSDTPSKMRKEALQQRALSSGVASDAEETPQRPTAPKVQMDFYEILPEDEGMEFHELKRSAKQPQAPAREKPASATVTSPQGTYYLQAGSFREEARAVGLKQRLAGLGFECEIQTVIINNKETYHRVRVGPFDGLEALDESRKKLGELGIEARTVESRE
jgi:cell division protein FtsN